MIHARDGADLSTGAAEEGFVRQIEFGTIDLPFLHFHFQLFVDELHDAAADDSFENVVAGRRRGKNTVPQQKEIRGRTFGDVPIVVENDGFIETRTIRVGLHEGGVHVSAGDLSSSGNRVVVDAAPRGYRHVHVLFVLVVLAERKHDDRNFGMQIMQPHSDDLIGIKGKGPDVEVLFVAFGANKLGESLYQLFVLVGHIHA